MSTEPMKETGNLSIHSENLMPIIKKWLYSDTDIFIRELVSNARDAIYKRQRLFQMGETITPPKGKILISTDEEAKTISITDNGIGMTKEEVKKYINQIAFSGAKDFLESYEIEDGEIIGHFGLGFYSAFMVASEVEIITQSCNKEEKAVHWVSNGEQEFTLETLEGDISVGTQIIIHVNTEGEYFLPTHRLRWVLEKYCKFMAEEIYIVEGEEETLINDTNPLWLTLPQDITDEDYISFYKDTFGDFKEPLFWIHLNMDYPFRLKGILYFPKIDPSHIKEGEVKLFVNQVFVAENVAEIIPEFLLLLKGVIDCPDLPLNVSRSFLQTDDTVRKMSSYITRKVADKLNELFMEDRERYTHYWNDISVFIKYGVVTDQKFYDRVKPSLLFDTIVGESVTLEELLQIGKIRDADLEKTDTTPEGETEESKTEETEIEEAKTEETKTEKTEIEEVVIEETKIEEGETGPTIFYVTDRKAQATYIELFKEKNKPAIILDGPVDEVFMQQLEMQAGLLMKRIDSDMSGFVQGAKDTLLDEKLTNLFTTVTTGNYLVETEKLNVDLPAIITESEESRRMAQFSKQMGGMGDIKTDEKLVINQNSPFIQLIMEMTDTEMQAKLMKQVISLAQLSHGNVEETFIYDYAKEVESILISLLTNENS